MPKENEKKWQEAKDAVNYPKSDPKYWPTVQMIYQRKIGSSVIIGARIINSKKFREKKVRWDEMNVHPKAPYRQPPFTSPISGSGSGNYPDQDEEAVENAIESSSEQTTRLQNPNWRQDDYSEDDDTWRSMFA